MPYGLLPLFASLVLGFCFVFFGDASRRSKFVVAAAVVVALLVAWGFPRWSLLATLFQVAVSVYVLLHLSLHRLGR